MMSGFCVPSLISSLNVFSCECVPAVCYTGLAVMTPGCVLDGSGCPLHREEAEASEWGSLCLQALLRSDDGSTVACQLLQRRTNTQKCVRGHVHAQLYFELSNIYALEPLVILLIALLSFIQGRVADNSSTSLFLIGVNSR